MEGYQGKLLEVNLSKNKTKETELEEEIAKKYIGGSGLAARLLYDSITKDLDPLGPDNPLAFINGPFVGGRVPSAGRHEVCAKSPLTGIWGESNSGGFFGAFLKMAGFDGVIIRGRADNPVYLSITDSGVSIEDASRYWGKGFYETRDSLKEEVGREKAKVAAIGQAGENLVKYAAVMNDHGRAAGRTGMGAVMGSKNLKAIIVDGNETVDIAKPDEMKELIDAATKIPLTDLSALSTMEIYKEFGTMGYLDMGMTLGDTPAKDFGQGMFPTGDVDAVALREEYHVESVSCFGCPIGCGRLVTHYDKHGVEEVDGPEYETAVAFGPLNMNFDLDTIVYANHLCNDFGMDTISTGVSIAFAVDLFEDGELSADDVGMELGWGDGEIVVDLVKKIAQREGFGDKLAEGVRRMASEFGVSAERAPQVKGMEVPMHDPRAFTGQAVSYATSPRGADHLKADYYLVDMGIDVPEIGVVAGDRFESSEEKGAMAARWQNARELYDSLPLCKFSPINSPEDLAKILNAVTGWDFDKEDIMRAGERIFNIKRMINWKLGVRKEDDKLPKVVSEFLPDGATAGRSPDMDVLLSGYYKERGWDSETGKPTEEKLEELGLSEEAQGL